MYDSATTGPDGASFIAVKRCCEAWNRAFDQARAKHKDCDDAEEAADKAYRREMPFLCGEDNIRAFIACVAEAAILGVMGEVEATKLVYIAQVALTGLPHQTRPVGRPRKSPEPPADEQAAPPQENPAQDPDQQTAAPEPDPNAACPEEPPQNPATDPEIAIQACAEKPGDAPEPVLNLPKGPDSETGDEFGIAPAPGPRSPGTSTRAKNKYPHPPISVPKRQASASFSVQTPPKPGCAPSLAPQTPPTRSLLTKFNSSSFSPQTNGTRYAPCQPDLP